MLRGTSVQKGANAYMQYLELSNAWSTIVAADSRERKGQGLSFIGTQFQLNKAK